MPCVVGGRGRVGAGAGAGVGGRGRVPMMALCVVVTSAVRQV